MKAYSPNGLPIETIHTVVYGANGFYPNSFSRSADGKLDFEYDDLGMRVGWDTAEPVRVRGKRVFFDSAGNDWTEDQLVLKEDDEEEAA